MSTERENKRFVGVMEGTFRALTDEMKDQDVQWLMFAKAARDEKITLHAIGGSAMQAHAAMQIAFYGLRRLIVDLEGPEEFTAELEALFKRFMGIEMVSAEWIDRE